MQKLLFGILSTLLVSCVPHLSSWEPNENTMTMESSLEPSIHFAPSKTSELKGIFLITHGLNTKPEAMDTLAAFLNHQGYHTYRIAWSVEGTASELLSRWDIQLRSAYAKAAHEYPGVPIDNLSFSLGGLVTLNAMKNEDGLAFNRVILLSPPLSLQSKTLVVKFLCLFKFLGVSLPSLAPDSYRRSRSTSLQAYAALFSLYRTARQTLSLQRIQDTRVLFVINQDDELVDVEATKTLVLCVASEHWKFITLRSQPNETLPSHLIVDEQSLGPFGWQTLSETIRDFID